MSWVLRLLAAFGLIVAVVSCTEAGSSSGDQDAIEISPDPEIVTRAELRFTVEDEGPVLVEVVAEDGTGYQVTTPTIEAGSHTFPLLELRPDTRYEVSLRSGDSETTSTFSTPPLPEDMPPIEARVTADRGQTGLTLFNVIPYGGDAADSGPNDAGYLVAVDGDGNVVWYYRQTHSIQDVRQTEGGQLLFIHHETGARLLDVVDGATSEWSGTTGLEDAPEDEHGRAYAGAEAVAVATDQMHHEVAPLPNGNLLTLSRELREINGFTEPICEDEEGDFDGSYEVVTDTVVEFEPDGTVVAEWSLFDYVDPVDTLEVIKPAEFCSPYLSDVYPDRPARDWTHANAVVLDEERNALLVSVRHLDQVFAIRYQDDDEGPAGELLWRLGEGGDFRLTEGEWFLHPHAPQVLSDGTIMIYDNGNERPGTSLDDPDSLPYSRAVQYSIDVEEGTATQVWEHRADAPGEAVYAPFVGDADMLEGGSVLITHGGLLDPPAHTPAAEGVIPWARIIEVDYDTGDILLDLHVADPDRDTGWIVYRAERISTMYPPEYDLERIGQ